MIWLRTYFGRFISRMEKPGNQKYQNNLVRKGYFAEWGALDFAGGMVVHVNAGFTALSACLIIGKTKLPREEPHNRPIHFLGTFLLWCGNSNHLSYVNKSGWLGFNSGSALVSNGTTGLAVLNTCIAAAIGGATNLLLAKCEVFFLVKFKNSTIEKSPYYGLEYLLNII